MGAIRSLTATSRETITHLATKAILHERSLVKTTRLRIMRPNLTRADTVWESRPASHDSASARLVETFAADGRTTWRLWETTDELTTWPTYATGEDSEK
jgi:hypothetical protein